MDSSHELVSSYAIGFISSIYLILLVGIESDMTELTLNDPNSPLPQLLFRTKMENSVSAATDFWALLYIELVTAIFFHAAVLTVQLNYTRT